MKKKRPKSSKAPAKREYDNASRKQKSQAAQKLIIDTLVTLLVERKGGEVLIEEIARRAKISERTIFRFFKDKAALHSETEMYLRSYLQASVMQIDRNDVVGFAKNVYSLFDQNENLTLAYLYSPFGQQAREIFRKQLNEYIFAHILKEKKLTLTPEREAKLAVIASLINAKLWQDIRLDFGLKGHVIGQAISEAMRVLIDDLK